MTAPLLVTAALAALAYLGGTRDPDDRSGSRFDLRARARYPLVGVRNKAIIHGACALLLSLPLGGLFGFGYAVGITLAAGVAWELGSGFVRVSDLVGDLAGALVGASAGAAWWG